MTAPPEGERHVVVIGAGPAGLTAAYELMRFNARPIVLEQSSTVGGLARTESYRGFHFDMGGHRFFTKVEEVEKLWHEILDGDFLRRRRLSRIYYRRKFFRYPLRGLDSLRGLGLGAGCLVLLSYLKWQVLPYRREDTFEHWVTNRFGRRLYQTFFKVYTEKVWGIPCSELKAEWAAQRIKDLSLRSVLLRMYLKPGTMIRTLIEEFHYPRLGPGMMWRAVQARIQGQGEVRLNSEVVRVLRTGDRVEAVVVSRAGREEIVGGRAFLSSMPVSDLVARLSPPPPPSVLAAARRLRYRDFLTVCLIVNAPHLFPDNWIYVHDPEVRVGRVQNFKNWSPDMVPDPARSSLGLEYFCTEGDELWRMPDADLVELGRREIERIGLARAADVEDGCVFRVPKAYPIYDSEYREALATVRTFVDGLANLQTMGRNGLHRYNNQDHAMLTGMLAARNVVLGARHDLWSVNVDAEYQEEAVVEKPEVVEQTLRRVFYRLDSVVLGSACGIVTGLGLFLLTLILAEWGPRDVLEALGLLGQYFPGFRASRAGSVSGLFYGFASGFGAGWFVGAARNAVVRAYLTVAHGRAEKNVLHRLLDNFS